MRPRPPGLASERTALAWVRSLIGLLGVGLLVSRGMLVHWPLLPAAAAITVVAGLVLGACYLGERRRIALRHPRPAPPRPGTIVAITAGAVLAAALGGVVLVR
ncbi:DUF202 domain-containing protein [Cryptosporangium arvum]|uniref:DUF202 domain-containing protein n=1 Tax=Cryptosporangium arvum DSM 44712 TaxID=927661 RepID=A0A011ABZ1_9ACTN|nr:DUF202 domain-containing protein [Cryptosporangium arvum]EXG79551.1 hypothetical protein CryarDRAFT_0592 [Cryptosporangium arvum DSM 44712]